mmetsp:Transcript_75526/g.191665  ORF Transcript_75526/g.191665 Transcript_75526/m.191665 type:complete len:449 (-) Transcript_75526:141-1487(-)
MPCDLKCRALTSRAVSTAAATATCEVRGAEAQPPSPHMPRFPLPALAPRRPRRLPALRSPLEAPASLPGAANSAAAVVAAAAEAASLEPLLPDTLRASGASTGVASRPGGWNSRASALNLLLCTVGGSIVHRSSLASAGDASLAMAAHDGDGTAEAVLAQEFEGVGVAVEEVEGLPLEPPPPRRKICRRSSLPPSHSASIDAASSATALTRTIMSPACSTFSAAPLLPHWRFQASTALPALTPSMRREVAASGPQDGWEVTRPNSAPSATRSVKPKMKASASSSELPSPTPCEDSCVPRGDVEGWLPPAARGGEPKPNASTSRSRSGECLVATGAGSHSTGEGVLGTSSRPGGQSMETSQPGHAGMDGQNEEAWKSCQGDSGAAGAAPPQAAAAAAVAASVRSASVRSPNWADTLATACFSESFSVCNDSCDLRKVATACSKARRSRS